MHNKTLIAVAIGAAISQGAFAAPAITGPMNFDPIAGSAYGMESDPSIPTQPWVIPDGYRQLIISDENDLNIYVGNDWNDMNTVN